MRSIPLWMRRGTGLWVFLPMAAFLIVAVVTSHPWRLDFDSGARNLAGAGFIFAPLVAAATAYDVGRRNGPVVDDLARSSSRGRWAVLAPAAAVALWAVLAAVVSWIAVGVVVAASDGLGPSDRWFVVETVAVLAAAAAVGAIVGCLVHGMLALAVAAGAVLLPALLLSSSGIKLFQVASGTGTMLGIERTPQRALFVLAVHLGITLVAVVVVVARFAEARGSRRWQLWPWSVVVLVAVLGAVWPITDSEYRAERGPVICVDRGGATVCGPARAERLWAAAAADFDAALDSLRTSGLDLPHRFDIARGEAHLAPGTASLDYDPSSLTGGHLTSTTIASTLSAPRECRAFYGGPDTMEYMGMLQTVTVWLQGEIDDPSGDPAPPEVVVAYTSLSSCPTLK